MRPAVSTPRRCHGARRRHRRTGYPSARLRLCPRAGRTQLPAAHRRRHCYNYPFAWRRYPASLMRYVHDDSVDHGILPDERQIQQVLEHLNVVVDVSPEELREVIEQSLLLARETGGGARTSTPLVVGGCYGSRRSGRHWSVREIVGLSGDGNDRRGTITYRIVEGKGPAPAGELLTGRIRTMGRPPVAAPPACAPPLIRAVPRPSAHRPRPMMPQARLQRLRLVLEQRRIVNRVAHHLLHVVTRFAEGDRFRVDGAFQRPVGAPLAGARRGRRCRRRRRAPGGCRGFP